MAMNLLLESLSRCLNGTSTAARGGGMASSAGLGNTHANEHDDRFEPAAVQVRLRDHARRGTSSGTRRRSTTPKNRNGRRRSAYDNDDDELQDLDVLADARRDAHQQQANTNSNKVDEDRSSSRRRRRQRSSPKLTVEERRNDIFRLPSDHPASRPSSPSADPNNTSTSRGSGRSRSSPRIHMVTPEPTAPNPLGIMCGRTSPAVFRRGSSDPSKMSVSNLLRDSTGGLRALCFASPVRDSQELAEERAAAAAANAAAHPNANGYPADDHTIDTFSLLAEGADDPTVNTADHTYATQDDTVASTHYFDAKLAHMVETSPPMPLYRQYEVTDSNPDHDIRKIVETNSHRSIKEAGVDLAGGLINVVKKKWSSPERTGGNSSRRAAPQAQPQAQPQVRRESSPRESRRHPTTSARTSRATTTAPPSSSPTTRPKKTSSNDPPTPPRHPRGYREDKAVAAAVAAARGRRSGSSEDSSVPSLEMSRNSSQSTAPSI